MYDSSIYYSFLTWCERVIIAIQLALCGGDWANESELNGHHVLEHLCLFDTVQEVDCTVSIESWTVGRVFCGQP